MRALSLWQPWAAAICLRWKRIETRHWTTDYRGALAIHAAKHWTGDEREMWADACEQEGFDATGYDMAFGAVVATVCLVDVLPTDRLVGRISEQEERWGNYGPKRYGFVFEGLQVLPEPVPFKGHQKFFDVPDALLRMPMAEPPPERQAKVLA